MRGMQRVRLGMRRMGWECGAGNEKNAGNQGDDVGNQSGNLGIAIDMR